MYSRTQLAKKYLQYYFKANNSKGHGTHSPFVFDFIIHVLNDKKEYECYSKIEAVRKELLTNKNEIEVEDFGAGSALISSNFRKINKIAASSLKRKKYAKLLFRIAKYYRLKTIVELGTSLGITTSYLASGDEDAKVFTLEGSKNIAKIAQQNFKKNSLKNIHLLQGIFEKTLPELLSQIQEVDLLFIDGNHRKKPTLEYFESFLKKAHPNSIFIFDDIHWSQQMEEAWEEIQKHPAVTLTIDLFFIGLVFFKHDFKQVQHFFIRF